MAEEKIYVGNGKLVGKFNQIKLGLRVDKLVSNEKGYCNIIIQEMKQPDKYGNTHTAIIDTWKPDSQRAQQSDQQQPPVDKSVPAGELVDEEDLPF
jgi:hypothetical protein